ncbi:MAG: hypothetical protein ABH879_01025 [archaeon]
MEDKKISKSLKRIGNHHHFMDCMKAYLAALLLIFGCATEVPIGGETDGHGCLGAAGYTWNIETGACIREWELDDNQRHAAKIAVDHYEKQVAVLGANNTGCEGCYSVSIQEKGCAPEMITLVDWVVFEPGMTEEQAVSIGKEKCAGGTLGETGIRNCDTGTWWIEFTPDEEKQGCNPACVVFDTGEAEINWRCTGIIRD